MRKTILLFLLLIMIQAKSEKLDTIYLYFRGENINNCVDFKLKVISKENLLLKEIAIIDSQRVIKIPIQKGIYNVLVESKNYMPTILQNVKSNLHYVIPKLFNNDPIIYDTIKTEPVDYIVIPFFLCEQCVPNLKLNEKEDLIVNQLVRWENPFQLKWDDFKIIDTVNINGCSSEILCELYVDIKRPSHYTWNWIKSSFKGLINRNKMGLYKDEKYFNVYAYINVDYSKVSKEMMTDDMLIYNRVIFNIYELSARKLRSYFSQNNSKKIYLYRETILEHSKDNCINLVQQFKNESNFGRNKEILYKWHIYIYNQLNIYNNYSKI